MTGRQADILRAAARCIARQGVRGLRVHDVAAEAGVSTSLLYYHFADRDGLLAATLEHVNEVAVEHRESGPGGDTPTTRLESLLLAEIRDDEDIRTGSVAWNELRATAVFEPSIREPLARSTAAWTARIAAALEGLEVDGDVAQLAMLLTALVEGVSGRWLGGELTTTEARALLSTAVIALIRPPPADVPSEEASR